MAKNRKSGSTHRPSRDPSAIANSFPSYFELLTVPNLTRSGRLTAIEDRRTFSPGRVTSPRTPRQVARMSMHPARQASGRKVEVYSFDLPRSVAICARRAIRKQVIHAKGVAGSKVRRPKRNAFSSISCRRK